MDDLYGAPISNLPPLAWLSGLNLGQGGLSGMQDPSMGGIGASATGPGMEGGLGLDALSELLQEQRGGELAAPGNAASLFQGIGQGTLAQGGPGYAIAGGSLSQPTEQAATGGYTAGQSQAGGIDPLAIIKQALGLAQKGVGVAQKAGQAEGYQTAGDTGQGAIDTTGLSLTGPDTGGLESLAQFFQGGLGGTSALSDPTLQLSLQGLLTGAGGTTNENILASLNADPALRDALFSGQVGGSLGETLTAPGGTAGFSLGGDTSLDTSLSGSLPPTNVGGAVQGGLGSALGLADILRAIESGNAGAGVQGGVGTLRGLSQLITSVPELGQVPGLSEISGLGSLIGAGGSIPASLGSLGGFTPGMASGFGLGGSLLGALGGLVGNKDLGTLGQVIGSLSQIPSLTAAASGATIGSLAAAGSGAAQAAITALPAVASMSAAAIPAIGAAIAMLTQLGMGIAADNPPGQITLDTLAAPDLIASQVVSRLIDPMFHPSKAWMSFPGRVGQTAALEGSSLGAIMKGLPYVQSQQELADVLAAFKSEIGSQVGGFGEGSGPYQIPNLPEVGTRTHAMKTRPVEFGPAVNTVQSIINSLLPMLPTTFQSPDNAEMRNFARFQDPSYATPQRFYDASLTPRYMKTFGTATPLHGGQVMIPTTDPAMFDATVRPGQGGYDYSAAGAYPVPSAPITAPMSAAWQQLMQSMQTQMMPPQAQAQMPMLPATDPSGLMALMQSGTPTAAPSIGTSRRGIEEEIRRMFAQYGVA